MRKRVFTIGSVLGVIVLSFAATRLRSQADFAEWVPMHLTREIVFHRADGSLEPDRNYEEIYQYRDGSTATRSTNTKDAVGTLGIMIAPTRHALSIDLATGKAYTWGYHGGTLTSQRQRRCAGNIHPVFEKVAREIVHVPVLGHDTEKITTEGRFGDKVHTTDRYMAPALGCMELRSDLWIDGVLKTSRIATAIAVGEQDESLLKKPANVEVVSSSEWNTQFLAARGDMR